MPAKRRPVNAQASEPEWLLTPDQLPPLKESHVIKQHKDFLEHRGWYLIRIHVGTFVPLRCFMALANAIKKGNPALIKKAVADAQRSIITIGKEGQSDYLAVHPQYGALWVEFKRPGGKIRPKQLTFYDEITRAYRFLAVITDNIDEFMAWYFPTYNPAQRAA